MLALKIHHIGYLVKDIKKALSSFQDLGFSIAQETVFDSIRKVNICFLEKDGYTIELVSPTDSTSVVTKLLKKYKNSPYHICYISQNMVSDIQALNNIGYICIDEPTPAPAFENKNVVFLMNPNLGMIELLDANS